MKVGAMAKFKNLLFPHSGPATTLGKISREFAKLQQQVDGDGQVDPNPPVVGEDALAQAKASSYVDIDFKNLSDEQIADLKTALGLK